ncbi:hypothetical protein B0H10DRAFT_2182921 [Mycena sp. CBHHK59/15]|nr:hypothetical protein B0H10DRAFT_2332805 [Mycena sp. CBHHK59/15]KAJ6631876.1 hypothetical protein B0H10DRAFT_2182921 [Mycena sp. CBHHK59/15]
MSSSSYATISALSILENPRKASPRTTVFDSLIFIGSPSLEKIQGSLRYYAEDDAAYPDAALYYIVFSVAKMEKGIKVFTDDAAEQAEYNFVGDIKTITLITACDTTAFTEIDVAQRAYVNVCGAVTRSDTNAATFTLDAEQYTSAFAEQAKHAAETGTVFTAKSVFPVIGFFPDSPRYKNKKPVPWVKRFVSFGGYLSGVSAALEGETLFERFRVEVDNIAFLGTYTPLASTPTSTAAASGSGGASSSKRPRFSYTQKRRRNDDDDTNGGAPTSSPSPSTF